MKNMTELLEIMRRLRDPESGCPWDIQQNFATIAPYTIEEAYEVADAIERNDMHDLRDELGDLLLQVIFHAQMADEAKLFNYSDVVDTLSEKLVRRHPHVFADLQVDSDHELHERWEQEKQREREKKSAAADDSALDGVTLGLPALKRAQKLQKKAARVGFDWADPEPVFDKISEEMDEVRQAMASGSREEQEEEVGDLLFAVVNLVRQLGLDSEEALRKANDKFSRRFRKLENVVKESGQLVEERSLEELEAVWRTVKKMQ